MHFFLPFLAFINETRLFFQSLLGFGHMKKRGRRLISVYMDCRYILYSNCRGCVWTSRTVCTDGMFSYNEYEFNVSLEQQYCTLLICTPEVLSVCFFWGGFLWDNGPPIYPDAEDAVKVLSDYFSLLLTWSETRPPLTTSSCCGDRIRLD